MCSSWTLSPPRLRNHLWQVPHCTAPRCSHTGFHRSATHLCLFLSDFRLKDLPQMPHFTAPDWGADSCCWFCGPKEVPNPSIIYNHSPYTRDCSTCKNKYHLATFTPISIHINSHFHRDVWYQQKRFPVHTPYRGEGPSTSGNISRVSIISFCSLFHESKAQSSRRPSFYHTWPFYPCGYHEAGL